MARKFKLKDNPKRSVDMDLFQDPKMHALSAYAKVLWMFLILPSCSGINCLSLRQMRIMVDRRAEDEAIGAALHELCEASIVRWDPDNEVIWVVRELEKQAPVPNWQLGAHVRNHLGALPPSPLIEQFLNYYHNWLVSAGVVDTGSSLPALRLVGPSCEAPTTTGQETQSATPIAIPYPMSKTETEIETETETATAPQSAAETESRTNVPPTPSWDEIEREVERIVLAAGLADTDLSASFLSPAVERVQENVATLDDVRAVTVEFKRRRGSDKTLRWRALFFAANWNETVREFLRREPPRRAARTRAPTSANSKLDEHWGEIAAATAPEVPPSPEHLARDEALIAGFLAGTTLDRSAGCG